mgnify:CR=1 FL=1|jgi:hypothetical protein
MPSDNAQFLCYFNGPNILETIMKTNCAFCNGTRLIFIWIVALAILINAIYNLVYFREDITVFQILKLPLIFCFAALLWKFFSNMKN